MAELKAKTLVQLEGLDINDLTSPKHDEIMFWLKKNYTNVLDIFNSSADNIRFEYPLTSKTGYIYGFLDALSHSRKTFRYNAFEIKASIQSFGETLRQLNLYKAALSSKDILIENFILVTIVLLNNEQISLFRDENIRYYHIEHL